MFKSPPNPYASLALSLLLCGCGQAKPEAKPSAPTNSTASATPDGATMPELKKAPAESKPAGPSNGKGADSAPSTTAAAVSPLGEAEFLSDDVVGLLVVHPRRLTESPVYQMVLDAALFDDLKRNIDQSPVKPEAIERAVLVLDQSWVNAVARMGNLEVENDDADPDMPGSLPVPSLIVSLANANDGDQVKKLFTDTETVDGETVHTHPLGAAWFSADEKTFVLGTKDGVLKLIATRKSGKPGNPKVLNHLNPAADLSLGISLVSQSALIGQVLERLPVPGLGLIQQIHGLALHLNPTGKPGGKLLEFVATAADEAAAETMSQIVSPNLEPQKASAQQQLAAIASLGDDGDKATAQLVQKIVASADIKQTGSQIALTVAIPEGYEKLPELLKPAIEKARSAAKGVQKKNNLKQIGLAFHIYHDVNKGFPGAGKSADGKAGLSWRVHLLPYLDQAPLYNEFHLDEAWDSDHNKGLIERMPALFRSDDVIEPGKTVMHVLTGPGAPFAKEAAPKIQDFTDGTSNTILVVIAAADTAEIWTKPGGLDFDTENPLKAFGELLGDTFTALICDGSVRDISKSIDPANLRRLIQSQDGEPIAEF